MNDSQNANALEITADAINQEHALARSHADSAIRHAIRCGELLTAKKRELAHGNFTPWVTANCEFQYSTAARYMKAAKQSSTGVEISTLSEVFASGRTRRQLPKADAGDSADPWYRKEWVDRIPMESGMVTFGCIGDTPVMALVESQLSPGFWHDFDLRTGTSSIRPCKPNGLRWRFMNDSVLAAVSWGTGPDSGDWLEGESEYWKQSDWMQRA
jgi:hypothetical protein